MKLSKDLVGASAVPLLLAILDDGENYGYAIIERVRELSGGNLEWTEGMLYPVLHRLETQGWVRVLGRIGSRAQRKYYCLTDAGKSALRDQKEQWELVHSTLVQAWGPGHA